MPMDKISNIDISSISPNPFNHGNSSTDFKQLNSDEEKELQLIITKGWNIDQVLSISLFVRNSTYSSTFLLKTSNYSYVFQKSNINNKKSQEINFLCESFANKNSIPTNQTIQSRYDKPYYAENSITYTLSKYIQGNHFSGELEELKNSARMQARFHQLFLNCDFTNRIINERKLVYKFSQTIWLKISKLAESGESNFDKFAFEIIKNINNKSNYLQEISKNIPKQIGHYDWHPHNLIFRDQKVVGILDFDLARYSYRALDIGLAMHKFSRVFGAKTQNKLDDGNDILSRCKTYLSAYQEISKISNQELSSMIGLLYSEIRSKIQYILEKHYIHSDESSDFDLEKQYVQHLELNLLRDLFYNNNES